MRIENHTILNFKYRGEEYKPCLPIPNIRARKAKGVDIQFFAEAMEVVDEPPVKENVMNVVPPTIAVLLWMRGRKDILTVFGWAQSQWLDGEPEVEGLMGAEARIFENLEPPQDRWAINDKWNREHPPVQAKD